MLDTKNKNHREAAYNLLIIGCKLEAGDIGDEEANDQMIIGINNLIKPESTFFKVKFVYDKNQQGRTVWTEDIRIFDAINSEDLHKKIDEYIKIRTNDIVNRWYYMKMTDVEKI